MNQDRLNDSLNRFESISDEYQPSPVDPDADAQILNAFIEELTGPTLDTNQRSLVRKDCERVLENNPGKPAVEAAVATIIARNIQAGA